MELVLLFKEALSRIEGLNFFGFTDANLALEHFIENKSDYALVISDFRMPIINGIQLLRKIKEINPVVRTMLISAFEINDELFQECMCVDKMLQKPIHMDILLSEVILLAANYKQKQRIEGLDKYESRH